MEYLGTITHQGVNYKYYKNTEGEILYDSEPEAENQNGCSVPIEQPESGMESILDELQTYVCSQICKILDNLTEDEKKQFCRNCRFDDLIDQIIEEHEK